MKRAVIWFKCAAMHDPVRPVIKKPAVLGWEAKQRQVDLVLDRSLRGEDLLLRMKGWFTADVHRVAEIVKQYGRLKVLDDYDLMVETEDMAGIDALSAKLRDEFGPEVWIEPEKKNLLK